MLLNLKQPSYFLGIDPGQNGALSIIKFNPGEWSIINNLVYCDSLRMHEVWGHKIFCPIHLLRVLDEIGIHKNNSFVLCEKVSPTKQGKVSAFNFGANSLGLINLLHQYCQVLPAVSPAQWKKALQLSSDKSQSISRALSLFNNDERINTHDKAEASLLALIGLTSTIKNHTKN